MKYKGKVLHFNKYVTNIQIANPKFTIGEVVTIKRGHNRTLSQNSLYWVFLTWCIENGLKDEGHFSPEALHQNLKAHFIAEKKMERKQFMAIEEATTTQLTRIEFGEYIENVNQFMLEYFQLDTGPFWSVHKK